MFAQHFRNASVGYKRMAQLGRDCGPKQPPVGWKLLQGLVRQAVSCWVDQSQQGSPEKKTFEEHAMGQKKGRGRYDCMSQTEGKGENMHMQRARNTVLMRDPKDKKRKQRGGVSSL